MTETYGPVSKTEEAQQIQQSLIKKGNSGALSAEVAKIPENKSFRGHNAEKPQHFLSSLTKELSSATSAEERKKMIKSHRKRF